MNIAYYNQDGFTIPLAQSLPQVVVIDSALVSVHTIELPRMSKSKLINAIAFKLEEAVLSDIDQLEFIPFKQSSPNIWDVIVIDRSVLTDIKNKLLNANIQPISIVPDFMLLAKHSNKVSYFEKDNQIIFRDGNHHGGKLAKQTFDQVFTDIEVLTKVDGFSQIVPTISLIKKGELSLWIHHLMPWLYPALALIVVIGLSTIQLNHSNKVLESQLQAITNNNQAIFKKTFPNTNKIVDMRKQAKQQLELAQQQAQNLRNDLLIALGKKTTPGKQLSKINYIDQLLTIKEIK